ncbi:hypothetical protein [Thioalkalivibrio sulfidiphilus]|uniref:hypothetical protein n=1 Tax=Thioalkalivibrio sulfidiphilus TaxID=1033854 RepID=UPI00036D254F|nr:hypothetical protein [Thioalkalivibrio sulfidiphilus]
MSCFRTLAAALALTLAAVPVASADSVEEVTYREHIRPLWENNCAACHGAASPYLGDFDEDKERFELAY